MVGPHQYGSRLALDISDGKQTDIWIYDWMRDTLSRLTSDPSNDEAPVWTPDGGRVVFWSNRNNRTRNLYWQRADGTGDVKRLTDSDVQQFPGLWDPTGDCWYSKPVLNPTGAPFRSCEWRATTRSVGNRISRSRLCAPHSINSSPAFLVMESGSPTSRMSQAVPDASTETADDHVTIVFNFFDELRRLAPSQR